MGITHTRTHVHIMGVGHARAAGPCVAHVPRPWDRDSCRGKPRPFTLRCRGGATTGRVGERDGDNGEPTDVRGTDASSRR